MSPATTGIAAMLLATLVMPVMALSVKALHALTVSTAEMMVLRSAIVLVVLLPALIPARRRLDVLHADKRFQAVHAFFGLASMACFYYALAFLPMVTVAAISFTTPMFLALIAMPVLGERLRGREAAALAVGFAGTLLVLRPSGESISLAAAVVLLGSALGAAQLIVIRRMPAASSNFAILIYYAWFGTAAFGIAAATLGWRLPPLAAWPWLLLLSVMALLLQWLFTLAFRLAPSTLVGGLDYIRLLWAGLLGYVALGETPGWSDILGMTLILASGLAIMVCEGRRARVDSPARVDSRQPSHQDSGLPIKEGSR